MRSGLLNRVVAFACRTQHSRLILAAVVTGNIVSPNLAQDAAPQLGQPQELRKLSTHQEQSYPQPGQPLESAPPFDPEGQARKITVGAPADSTPEKAASSTPQPYERTPGQAPPLKNYRAELFGENDAPRDQPTVQTIPTTAQGDSGAIRHAEFQYNPASQSTATITTVGHEQPVQSADLPEWARNAKRNSQGETKKPVVAEISINPPRESRGPSLNLQSQPARPTEQPASRESLPEQLQESDLATRTTTNAEAVDLGKLLAGPQTPSVQIEWKSTSEINVGQECDCELLVSNVGKSPAFGVKVETNFPVSVRLLEAEPRPQTTESSLVWDLGTLDAGKSKSISIKLIPSEKGDLQAVARVHITGAATSAFVVREPKIQLDIQGPQKVMIGDPASHNVTITNPGNGTAKNVRLEALIPRGLEHSRGERLLLDVGSLNPGESRTIRLALAAVDGGDHVVQVAATADGGLSRSSEAAVSVIAPSLQTEITGPSLRYKGRQATFTVRVTNDGSVATSNVRLMHKVPEGFQFISANRGATFDAPTRILSWFVGKLEAGKSADMQVELKAEQIGEHVHYIRATSEHGSTVDSQLLTRVDGSSSLVVEVTDLDDPVEVGNETAYEVKILNEGSVAAKNVGLTCELPAGVRFLKGEGPGQHVAEGSMVLFQPLNQIDAGKSVTYRVHVIGTQEGNLRFRARVTSAASEEPLIFEELTRFYSDGN